MSSPTDASTGGEPAPALRLRRPFNWGIVMLWDERFGDPPAPGPADICVSERGAIVSVHHAQDVALDGLADDEDVPPFEVEIVCWLHAAPSDISLGGSGMVAVPTGRLAVGDAEHQDIIESTPGNWLVQCKGSPPEYPDRLDVWISPADRGL